MPGFVQRRWNGREWCYLAQELATGKRRHMRHGGEISSCSAWHHSRPFHRLWTNPGTVSIYIVYSTCWSTQSLHQGSNLYLPQSPPDLKIISYSEIAGDRGRLPSRSLTVQTSSWALRVKNEVIHNGRVCPEAMVWLSLAAFAGSAGKGSI